MKKREPSTRRKISNVSQRTTESRIQAEDLLLQIGDDVQAGSSEGTSGSQAQRGAQQKALASAATVAGKARIAAAKKRAVDPPTARGTSSTVASPTAGANNNNNNNNNSNSNSSNSNSNNNNISNTASPSSPTHANTGPPRLRPSTANTERTDRTGSGGSAKEVLSRTTFGKKLSQRSTSSGQAPNGDVSDASSSDYEVVIKRAPTLIVHSPGTARKTVLPPELQEVEGLEDELIVRLLNELRLRLRSDLEESQKLILEKLESLKKTPLATSNPLSSWPLAPKAGSGNAGVIGKTNSSAPELQAEQTQVDASHTMSEEEEQDAWGHRHLITYQTGQQLQRRNTEARLSENGVSALGRFSVNPTFLKEMMTHRVTTMTSGSEKSDGYRDHNGWHRFRACHHCIVTIVASQYFDYFFGAMVVLNAVLIGWLLEWQSQRLTERTPGFFDAAEILFFVLFVAELALRAAAHGRKIFTRNWQWNLFDLISVLSQFFEMLGDSLVDATNLSFVRIIRTLRLVRVLRLMRILRLVGELRTLVMSILGSLRSLIWAIVLLFALVYVVAIYIAQVVLRHRIDQARLGIESSSELVDAWGTLGQSIWSLYQAVTGGVDWYDICGPLEKEVSVWLMLVFALYIAFALLCMLNVITGVFVESALLTANADKDVYMVNHLRSLFTQTDVDHTGTVDWEEFSQMLHTKEMQEVFKAVDIDVSEARALFRLLDMSGSGKIAIGDFISGCNRLRGPAKSLELTILHRETLKLAEKVYKHSKMVEMKMHNIEHFLAATAFPMADGGNMATKSSLESQRKNVKGSAYSEVYYTRASGGSLPPAMDIYAA